MPSHTEADPSMVKKITYRMTWSLLLLALLTLGITLFSFQAYNQNVMLSEKESALEQSSSLFIHLADNYLKSKSSNTGSNAFIDRLKGFTDSEYTFFRPANTTLSPAPRQGAPLDQEALTSLTGVVDIVSSTLPENESRQLRDQLREVTPSKLATAFTVSTGETEYLTRILTFNISSQQAIITIIQKPLPTLLASLGSLPILLILALALASSLLAMVIAYLLGRNITATVNRLIGAAQAVQQGGQHWVGMAYLSKSLSLERSDELGHLAAAFNRMVRVLEEKEQMQNLLGKVVSREIADELLQNEIKLGGEERQVTVLFMDIRNFTGLSEGHSPERVLNLLNTCLNEASQIIEQHHGVVDKYIGDSVMALFGAPLKRSDDTHNAVSAALAIEASLDALNSKLKQSDFKPIKVGMGISTGNVVAGNMGSLNRLNYTVIGDNVNIASRLEGLTKQYGTPVLVNEATKKIADRFLYRVVDRVQVRGKRQFTTLYQPLCDRENVSQSTNTLLQKHQTAITLYSNQEWGKAQNAFEELSRLEPDTSLYKLYIQRCLQFLDSPPDKEWDGVFHQNHPDSSSLSSSKRPLNDDSV